MDILKIDRSFVYDLQVNPDDGAIVEAVIELGASLGMDVVAEGIEAVAQWRSLLALGCKYGQGYLFGKAMPAADVRALTAASATTPRQERLSLQDGIARTE